MLSCWRETFLTKKDFATWKLRSSPRSSNAFYLLSLQCTQCSSPHCSSEVLEMLQWEFQNKETKSNLCRQTRRLDGTLEEGERWPWPRWTSSHWTGTSPAGDGSLDQDGNLISKPYLVNSGTATEFATSPTIDTTISTTPSSQNVNSARSSCSSSHLDVMLFMPRDVFSIMETFSKKTENAGSTNKSNRCCCNR